MKLFQVNVRAPTRDAALELAREGTWKERTSKGDLGARDLGVQTVGTTEGCVHELPVEGEPELLGLFS